MADADEWDSMEQKTSTMVHNAITQLHIIWTEVGYDKETQLVYTDAALDHVQELLTDMVSEFEDKKRLLLEETEQLMQNTSILCKELKETIDTSGYEKLPLFKLQQVLQHDMEKLLRIKEQRKTYLNELLMKEHEICKRLGVQPIGIESKLPTEEELDNFKLYIYKQEAEKDRIESEFKNKYNTIIKMVQDLGISPSSNFEETVCNNPENFILNPANMTMLKDFQEKLEKQLKSAKEEVENKKEELLALWGTLDEPNDFCHAFLDNYPGYSQATIKAINAEISRCKEIAHIAKYVNRVRAELVNMWDLCKYEEFLAQSWANRDIEKESKKNARKEAKDKSTKKASVTKRTPAASTSRIQTPLCTSTKRKLIFGSTPNSSAKRRNIGNDKVRSVTYASKIRRSGKISRRALSENKKRRSDLGKTRSPSQNTGTVDTTYGQFQAHLKEREELRSSLLTDQSLSAKCILKTPNRTQVKPVRRNLYNVNASSTATSKLLQSTRNSPRSPRVVHTSKLATAPNVLPIIF
ncbi:hypothetical protein M0804_012731 [Polistes exclamans]|nr:hypothetical protein M0804_012731 [Polistes exclamans]